MDQLFPYLGHWVWWTVAGVLLVGELTLPGIFLIWLALAAAIVGLIDLGLDLGWQAELILFCALAVVSVFAGRTWFAWRGSAATDQPHLNRRSQSYVGGRYPLEQAIADGRGGRLRIDDTLWDAVGPDLPKGAMVKVTAVEGLRLRVEPV